MKGVGIGLGVLGLIIGILWANHVWRKYGTIHFWSKISATPELDAESKEPEVENKKAK